MLDAVELADGHNPDADASLPDTEIDAVADSSTLAGHGSNGAADVGLLAALHLMLAGALG